MLNNVALFCTDPPNMDVKFTGGRDLVIDPPDATQSMKRYRLSSAELV